MRRGKESDREVHKLTTLPSLSQDLAVIFQPGIFSHPSHLQDANEHKLAVEVLEFLIEHQDHFLIGLSAPSPSNVDPSQLTSVSIVNQAQDVPDVAELSDSDEELGVLTMHEGGGAKLGRRSTTAGAGGPRKGGRLFKSRKSGGSTPAANLTVSGGEEAGSISSAGTEADAETTTPSSPKGEIREMGLGGSPGLKGIGGLRRSRTVPSRRAKEEKEEKRSASSGKAKTKRDRTTSRPERAPVPQEEDVVATESGNAVDSGIPTPPPSQLLAGEEKAS